MVTPHAWIATQTAISDQAKRSFVSIRGYFSVSPPFSTRIPSQLQWNVAHVYGTDEDGCDRTGFPPDEEWPCLRLLQHGERNSLVLDDHAEASIRRGRRAKADPLPVFENR
jgi:hypothetical protein